MKNKIVFLIFVMLVIMCFVKKPFTTAPSPRAAYLSPQEQPQDKNQPAVKMGSLERVPAASSSLPRIKKKDSDEKLDRCFKKYIAEEKNRSAFKEKIKKRAQAKIAGWIYDVSETLEDVKEDSEVDLFYRGLFAAGFLAGRDEGEVNQDQAIDFFKKSYELDPENSAPLLFWAVIEKTRGNGDKAQELLEKAHEQTSHYNSHLKFLAQTIYEEVDAPLDVLLALNEISELPIPSLNVVTQVLRDEKQFDFGYQLMGDNLNPKRAVDFVEYSTLEYVSGRSLVKNIPQSESYPDINSFTEQKYKADPFGLDSSLEKFSEKCELSELVSVVQKIRGYNFLK